MDAVTGQESDKEANRLRREPEHAGQQSRGYGGRRPFGYEPGGMELRHDEAVVVRELTERLLAGESLRALAAEMNQRGVSTVYSGFWRTSTLRTLLATPRLAGLSSHKGEVVGEAQWPAIISREQHEQIRTILGAQQRVLRGGSTMNLLTSMVVCGSCGERMSASQRRGRDPRYVCHATVGTRECGRVGVHAEHLEREVTQRLLSVLDGLGLAETILANGDDTTTAGVAQEPKAGGDRMAQLPQGLAVGRVAPGDWLLPREGVARHIGGAGHTLGYDGSTSVPASRAPENQELRDVWDGAAPEWRRSLLIAVFDRVVVHPVGAHQRRVFNPDRVEVQCRA